MTAFEQLDPQALPNEAAERQRVAQERKQKALAAFQRQELLVATLHASDALMLFPNEREYLDCFDEIVLSTDDSLALLPVATGAIHVATAAGRARVLMMQQKMPEALDLVCAAVRVAPDIAYLDWVRRWFLVPHVIPNLPWEVALDTAVKTAIEVAVDVPVPPDADDPRLPNVRAAADYLANLRGRFADQVVLYVAETIARRRLGDPTAAIIVGNQGVERFGDDWNMRTALANALGDAGRIDEAEPHARHAVNLRADDMSPLYDLARAKHRAGDFMGAASLLEEVQRCEPSYPGALPLLHHARFKMSGSDEDRQVLLILRERSWHDRDVRELANDIDPPTNNITVLPGPGDATANAARALADELGHVIRCCGVSNVTLGLRSRYPESPSVSAAFDTALRALGSRGSLAIDVEEAPQPDPRADKAGITFRLWNWNGNQPQKAYPEADPQLQQAISHIANTLFRKDTWGPAAQALAAQLGPDALHGLLAVLTSPAPPPPDTFDGVYWTYRCQVATAVVLSHLGPYPAEPARQALTSMLYGPSDWTTSAAIIALTWRAMDDPTARQEVDAIFQWMRGQIPSVGFTTWEIVLADCMMALGGADPAVREELTAWIVAYEKSLPNKNIVRPPERQYGGLTLEQYAEFCMERDKLIGTIGYGGWGAAVDAFVGGNVSPELPALCQRFGVPLHHPETGVVFPWIGEWQEALNANPKLHRRFLEIQKGIELERHGVSGEEKAALDNILDGNMDMHLRMAEAQAAQSAVAAGDAGDPDPVVFPGQPVAKLSDYVAILKGMQGGDMAGALAPYGLDMMAYGSVATAWGAKMAADPVLTEKFTRMMNG